MWQAFEGKAGNLQTRMDSVIRKTNEKKDPAILE